MTRTVTVTFEPDGTSIAVPVGTRLQDAAAQAGVYLEHPCGGRGICGKCQVQVGGEASPPTEVERDVLPPELLAQGRRLSCQLEILGRVEVHVIQDRPSAEVILKEGKEPFYELNPPVNAIHLALREPSVEDQRSDEERVLDALRSAGKEVQPIPQDILRALPGCLRGADWSVTAILRGSHWLTIRPGDTTRRIFGIAVDLGTTTVVASLHDLRSGQELAKCGLVNEQIVCGADVISRMTYLRAGDDGLRTLNKHAINTVNRLIDELLIQAEVSRDETHVISVVGNTTMQQILLNIDPTPIGASPFTPAFRRPTVWPAHDLGLRIHPDGCVCVAPVIAGYVGGDIVADILASALYESEDPVLLVDLGTNAEIVLADRHEIITCACAAGPAFEGGEISQGMRAVRGAIESVWVEGEDLRLGVIGDVEPTGICGSGLVDALAVLLDIGAVERGGRLLPPDEYTGPKWIKQRLKQESEGITFLLGGKEERLISLTEQDIRKIQLAKGAVKAGTKILCHERNLSPMDIKRVLVAGAFGSHLQPESALRIGLIPPLDPKQVHFIGNAAWVGAKMMLLSMVVARRAWSLVDQARYVELSGRPDFQSEFGLSMRFDDD